MKRLLLLLLFLTACHDSGTGQVDAGPDLSVGEDIPMADIMPPPPEGDWVLTPPAVSRAEPADFLRFELTEVNVLADEVLVWLDDDTLMLPYSIVVTDTGADPDALSDDTLELRLFVPYTTAGQHDLSFGTDTERETARFEFEVRIRSPRLSQSEAASALRDGILALTGEVRSTLETGFPTEFKEAHFDTETLQHMTTLLDGVDALAEQVHAEMMALSPEDAELAIVMLDNVGTLKILEAAAGPTGTGGGEFGTISAPLTYSEIHAHPIHGALYKLDTIAMALRVAGSGVVVMNLLSVLTGGSTLALGLTVNVCLEVTRGLLDIYMPTDLVSIEAQPQSLLFSNEGATWIFWGTFEPEKALAAGGAGLITNILSSVIASLVPTSTGVQSAIKPLVAGIIKQLPQKLADAVLDYSSHPGVAKRVTTLMNLSVYSIKLSDLSLVLPFLAPTIKFIAMFVDIELSASIWVDTEGLPSWASDAEISYAYDRDVLAVEGVEWPTDTNQRLMTIYARGYRWRAVPAGSFLGVNVPLNRPSMELHTSSFPVMVQKEPTGEQLLSDEDYIITRVRDSTGAEVDDGWVTGFTPNARRHDMTLKNLYIETFADDGVLEISVNGETRYANFVIPNDGGKVTAPLELVPGKNTVSIGLVSGYENQRPGTQYWYQAEMDLPDVANVDSTRQLDFGGAHTFTIWTPPEATVQ